MTSTALLLGQRSRESNGSRWRMPLACALALAAAACSAEGAESPAPGSNQMSYALTRTSSIDTCGNGFCTEGETCENCPLDCGRCPICGDGLCEPGECETCPADCGSRCQAYCGDGICEGPEDCSSCPADCLCNGAL